MAAPPAFPFWVTQGSYTPISSTFQRRFRDLPAPAITFHRKFFNRFYNAMPQTGENNLLAITVWSFCRAYCFSLFWLKYGVFWLFIEVDNGGALDYKYANHENHETYCSRI
jgi:hypothetical protein